MSATALEEIRLDMIETAENDLVNYGEMIQDAEEHLVELRKERTAIETRLGLLKSSRIVDRAAA